MSKTINTLAALFIAAITLPSTAEAGGVRLQFGGPLGTFVAHPNLSSGPGGTMKNRGYGKSQHSYQAEAKQRAMSKARKFAAEREARAIARARKAELARAAAADARRQRIELATRKAQSIQTAKADNTVKTISDPVVVIPDSPAAQVNFTGTQSSPATARTAALDAHNATSATGVEADAKTEVVVLPVVEAKDVETAQTVQTAQTAPTTVPETSNQVTSSVSRAASEVANTVCRRFSAAVASLIEVPCK